MWPAPSCRCRRAEGGVPANAMLHMAHPVCLGNIVTQYTVFGSRVGYLSEDAGIEDSRVGVAVNIMAIMLMLYF